MQGDAANDFITVTCAGGNLAATGVSTTDDACASLFQVLVSPGEGADSVNLAGVTPVAVPTLATTVVDVAELVGSAADTVQGSPGSDIIEGDDLDTLNGNDGPDILTGGATVNGGLGDHTISEFNGSGSAVGGPEDDRFVQFLAPLEGGTGVDSLEIDLDRTNVSFGTDLMLVLNADQFSVINGPATTDVAMSGLEQLYLTLFRKESQSIDGSAFPGIQNVRGMSGIDTISGGGLDDNLHGGGGNDTVTGNGGADVLHGGGGCGRRDAVEEGVHGPPGLTACGRRGLRR